MRGASLVALLLVVGSFAGCVGSSERDEPPAAPEEPAAPSGPSWEPNPPIGPQPVLRPGTGWTVTAWGFVRANWTPPAEARPVILVANGYEGAGAPSHYLRVRDGTYVAVRVVPDLAYYPGYALAVASIRGTGCSGGAFDLFDETHAQDGFEVVEWLARELWSTGRIGIAGHSYGGLTGFLIAATGPPSLGAVAVSGLIDDLYRDIAYPGGVPNLGFPVVWSTAFRPASDAQGTEAGLAQGDEICAWNVARRPPAAVTDHFATKLVGRTDDEWYRARSLEGHAAKVRAPILIGHAWQDEQTGPRGAPELFRILAPDAVEHDGTWVVPKQLVATNGVHRSQDIARYNASLPWFDRFLRDLPNGVLDEPPVRILLETVTVSEEDSIAPGLVAPMDAWPASGTAWTPLYLGPEGVLLGEPPADAASSMLLGGRPAQNWAFTDIGYYVLDSVLPPPEADTRGEQAPDVLRFRTEPLQAPLLVAGPVTATLFLSTTAPDADLFVSVADVQPDGKVTPLQRGVLRASHRALDAERTLVNATGEIVRPYHPHTNPQPLPVGETVEYVLEVFPLAHLFREGHRLQVTIATPPVADGLYSYDPARPAAIHTLHHDADHPSRVLIPALPVPAALPEEPGCGIPDGYACLDSFP